jgi:hypothetical protein
MKKDEIPQDASKLENKNMKELCYAVDERGNYSTGLSSGWEPKSIALDLTMDNLNQQIEEAKQEVLNGTKSPLFYFMIQSKMDLGVLASYMGKYKWIVKRHFKPGVFKKLKNSTLIKYADIFETDVKKIRNFNE